MLAPSSERRLRVVHLEMTGPSSAADRGWEDIYERLYPKLFAFCRRRLGSDDAAEDAVAESVARALAAADRFNAGASGVDGWLFGICRNVIAERWRSAARDARWPDLGAQLVALGEDGPLDTVLATERRRRLVDAFSRLDEAEQDLLELRVMAGLDTKHIADALGKRPGAIRMAQSRALARLRAFMEEEGE